MSTSQAMPILELDEIKRRNQTFYDCLWRHSKLYSGSAFNTWPALERHVEESDDRLEIGPGLKPRLSIPGTTFIDLSTVATEKLARAGGNAILGSIDQIPCVDNAFDLVCAFDVVEHVSDDHRALSEIARVLRRGGTFFFSVPLSMQAWTKFDTTVGHARRYEREEILNLLASFGFSVKRSAIYGMMPKKAWITTLGMTVLNRFPRFAMAFYNRLFFPLLLHKQPTLEFHDGMVEDDRVRELIIECTLEQ